MTMATQQDSIEQLLTLLEQQNHCYLRLRELSADQQRIVGQAVPEMPELLTVLSDRQRVIEQLMQLASLLQPYREDWQDVWNSLNTEQRKRVQELVSGAQERLDQVMAADEADRKVLATMRDALVGEMGRLDKGARARNVYGSQSNSGPRFTDETG